MNEETSKLKRPKFPPPRYESDGGCLIFIIAGVFGLILALA